MGADDASTDDLRVAHRASVASIVWSAVAGTAMIVIGGLQSSTVLVAVGAVGYVDGVGSVALVHHFAHGLRHAELDDRFERRAHRIVTVGLLIVGVATGAVSIVRLAAGTVSDAGAAATIVAGASAIVLAALATIKVRVGRRIPSHALVADGHVSAIGAAEAVVACAGALLTAALDVHWADPIAATIVAAGAIALALRSWNAPTD
jgi:divalent metal cation (Fe/Co/Zn/Cd) transporter